VFHVHFNGAGGNVTAGKYNDGDPANRPVLAERLARGMKSAFESVKKYPVTGRDVSWRTTAVALPLSKRYKSRELEGLVADDKLSERDRLRSARSLVWARRCEAGEKIDLACLRVGPAYVLHMPGELFVEYQLAAQKMKPDAAVLMAAYGDYAPGYIGTAVAYGQGGYETGPVSRVAPEVEEVLMRAMRELLTQEVSDYEWVQVTPKAAFAPRDGAGALVFQNRLWLLGGWNPADKKHFPRICNNEVWSSADGADWRLEKANTFVDERFDADRDWEGRHTAGYVVYNDKMWIVGGDVNQKHYQSDVWNSADGKSWTLVNKGRPVPWGPRALHYTAVFRDRIWVLGGQTMPAFGGGEERFYRDIWNSADGVHWEKVTPREPYWSARGMIGGGAVFKGRLWLLGGGTYDTPTTPDRKFFSEVWSTADGVKWERHLERAPWEPRQYHDVAVFDGRLWVLEGYSGRNRNDVWYSADGVTWHELPGTPWAPRHAASVYVHAGALWVVAGNNMESDVWKLRRKR
jgi:hypothetical protein